MAIKRRERELTAEEAIAQAKNELQTYWYGSPPLFAALPAPEGSAGPPRVFPVDSSFVQKMWVLVFVDPTQLLSRRLVDYASEWNRRYREFKIDFLMVSRSEYPTYGVSRMAVQEWIRRRRLDFTLLVDFDLKTREAFGAKVLPKVVFFDKGKPISELSGRDCQEKFELALHPYLRAADPGLPLYPPFVSPNPERTESARYDFGADFKGRCEAPSGLEVIGKWQVEGDRMETTDSSAKIRFVCPDTAFAIIAKTMSAELTPTRMLVEIEDSPVLDIHLGPDCQFDDEGRSFIRMQTEQLFFVAQSLSEDRRSVTLSFPDATATGVAVFGLRFVH